MQKRCPFSVIGVRRLDLYLLIAAYTGIHFSGGRQWQCKHLEGTGIFALHFRLTHEFDLPFHPIDRGSECDRRGGCVQALYDDGDHRLVTGDVHFVQATRRPIVWEDTMKIKAIVTGAVSFVLFNRSVSFIRPRPLYG